MRVDIVVLNYNGRTLLEQCLGSVVRAAGASAHDCRVTVIDNASTDGSRELLQSKFKQVKVLERDNRGLCSYNTVLTELDGQVAILLNNDVKLEPGAIDALIEPHVDPTPSGRKRLFFTAPQCWRLDDRSYEGFRTAIDWSWGVVSATWDFDGYETGIERTCLTASVGAALAVDRELFLKLGGFDPLYLPGRIEDLDLAFRAYLAGYVGWYVPDAKVWHVGAATFNEVYGERGCDDLALRNTLLFQWKCLRWPWHWARMFAGLAARMTWDVLAAPWERDARRWRSWRALFGALRRLRVANRSSGERHPTPHMYFLGRRWWRHVHREGQFFHRFSYEQMGGIPHGEPAWSYRRLLGLDDDAPTAVVRREKADMDVVAAAGPT